MSADLPYSQASENNKLAILEVLKRHLASRESLLEIGGGTGQHAVFFASSFPNLHWQSSDIAENIDSLNLRISQSQLVNLPKAIELNVDDVSWSQHSNQSSENESSSHVSSPDVIFTANSLHIMSEQSVENFFKGVKRHLNIGGLVLLYGPFKYRNEFTTQSNAQFDLWLKERNPESGIRDFEKIKALAEAADLQLIEDNTMPANNQLLVWSRKE
ncbi:MAG: DUF938 domain-containing protein [Pseudohongiellaceae bacterium]